MQTEMQITVRSTEIDGNGHVNNAKYLEYLEWARQEWNTEVGLTPEALDQYGIKLVTVNININYKKESRHGQKLVVMTKVEKVGRSSFALSQTIHNEAGELVAEAVTTRVAVQKADAKSCAIPDELKEKFVIQVGG
ncbi:thioesterase family protein [Ammoniphilus sp. CFH 90114]|uniref:acyl-CoA thioesterase n=1 Tax=Ammoniphilus sp. CFH 90114 TaxID=2493665 RepID=UPI0013E945C1|nr:thioesterase family protein [Ammoniphilus sp. CFH 90114]